MATALMTCAGLHASGADSLRMSVPDPWLMSPNAAALTRYAYKGIGTAQLSLTRGRGGFTDFSDSPDALTFNASVESFFRLSRRAVVYGAMSYTNFSGHDMAGSAFMRSVHVTPTASRTAYGQTLAAGSHGELPLRDAGRQNSRHLPFDIVEDSLTNTGTKHQDTYRLSGGLGYDVGNGLSLGARLDYTAANMAKYKDLRHQNKLMDLELTAGVYIPLRLGRFSGHTRGAAPTGLGVNYLYHRTTESLLFSTYGKNDKVYNSLVSYAGFMGHIEQFGSTGYTDKSREMPLVSDYNGVGVQLSLGRAKPEQKDGKASVQFFNSFTYAHRRGYYGRRSPYTITYTGHESDIYSNCARLSMLTRRAAFHLDFSVNVENLRNDAANYRGLQNEQGATYYEYYTPVKTANKLWKDGSLAFTAELYGTRADGPTRETHGPTQDAYGPTRDAHGPARGAVPSSVGVWQIRCGLNWNGREQTAYAYPFGRRQALNSKEGFVSVSRNVFMHKKNRPDSCQAYWSFTLRFSFLKGSGQPYEDFLYQTPSAGQEPPAVMDAWLWREYVWLTAAQFQVGGAVRYSFIMPWAGLRTYVLLGLSHRKANESSDYSIGQNRTALSVDVGCEF